jgi:hypothetical protein
MTTVKSVWTDKRPITLTNKQVLELARVQKKQHLALGIILSGFPVLICVALLSEFTPFAPVFAILYMIAFAYAGLLIGKQKCPHCNKNFFWGWGLKNPLAYKCIHCGLQFGITGNKANVYKGYENINNK